MNIHFTQIQAEGIARLLQLTPLERDTLINFVADNIAPFDLLITQGGSGYRVHVETTVDITDYGSRNHE